MHFRAAVHGCAIAACTTLFACGGGSHGAPRNLLLISVDGLRADHLGCFGQERDLSPNVDRLAEESALFEAAISPTPTTLPANVSLLTGDYPHRHGVARDGYRVAPDNALLAELLAAAGFRTAGFVGSSRLGAETGFDAGFEDFDGAPARRLSGAPPIERPADRVTDAALAWPGYTGDGERPWFVFVDYGDPCAPYEPPPPFEGRFRGRPLATANGAEEIAHVAPRLRAAAGSGYRSLADVEEGFRERASDSLVEAANLARELAGDYAAEVAFVDHEIGRLLDDLRGRGLLDDTLVVLTAGHGETLFEHADVFSHGSSVYDTELRVPLVVRVPHGGSAGLRVPAVVSLVDVAPTVLELLGLTPPAGLDGRSLAAALGGAELPPRPAFAEASAPAGAPFGGDPLWENRGRFQAVRTERYKYMFRRPDGQARLYDVVADPLEQHDLLRDADYDADLAGRLEQQLVEWWSDVGRGRSPDRASGPPQQEPGAAEDR